MEVDKKSFDENGNEQIVIAGRFLFSGEHHANGFPVVRQMLSEPWCMLAVVPPMLDFAFDCEMTEEQLKNEKTKRDLKRGRDYEVLKDVVPKKIRCIP